MSETFDDKLGKIEQYEAVVLDCCKAIIQPGAGIMIVDFTLLAAAKRTIALSSGFRSSMKDRNFICAASLMRMQLDTALRLYAGGLYAAGPTQYFQDVFDGKAVDRMKDVHGQRLTDSYLAKRLNEQYPWVLSVYKNLCDVVHLSNRHIFNTMSDLDEEDRSFQISIRADTERPDADYFEILDAFLSCTKANVALLRSWIKVRAPPKAA